MIKIDKYNRRNFYILNQLEKKALELYSSNKSEEYRNYFFRRTVKNLINIGSTEKIVNPISSNLIDKTNIENIFENTVETLKMIDEKLNELSFLNENLNSNIENIINPLFLKIKKMDFNKQIEVLSPSVITESFNKTKFFENKNCSLKNSFLELVNDEYYNEIFSAIVEVTSSNGIPGDTHRAYIENGEITFNGEEELNINLNNIFSKSSSLVYETISIQQDEYKKTKGFGFTYDEGISFLNNDPTLKLNIKVKFNNPKKMNVIKFNDSQITNYVITKLKVIDENGTIITIADNKNSSIFNIFNFRECNVTTILFELTQFNKEKTYIGHFYKTSLKESNNSFKVEYENINIGSILNLGVTVGDDNKIKHGKVSSISNAIFSKENIIKKNLYNNNLNRELIKAERASISINSLTCFLKKYREAGSCIFRYEVKNNIKGVTFDANEFVPKGTSIEYHISFDNYNWHNIKPLYRVGNDEIHTINLNSVITSSNINSKTIFTNDKQFEIYLKIDLKTSNKNISPIVNSFSFKIRE